MLLNAIFGILYTGWNWICVNYPYEITSNLQIKMSTYELLVALIIGSSIMSRFRKRNKLYYFQQHPFKQNNNSIFTHLSFIVDRHNVWTDTDFVQTYRFYTQSIRYVYKSSKKWNSTWCVNEFIFSQFIVFVCFRSVYTNVTLLVQSFWDRWDSMPVQ